MQIGMRAEEATALGLKIEAELVKATLLLEHKPGTVKLIQDKMWGASDTPQQDSFIPYEIPYDLFPPFPPPDSGQRAGAEQRSGGNLNTTRVKILSLISMKQIRFFGFIR